MKANVSDVNAQRFTSDASREAHEHPNYIGIWRWLLALTVGEVAVVYLHLARPLLLSSLLIFALAKAALVAMYFMHLKFEKILLTLIFTSPLILSVVLTVLVLFDTPLFH